MSEDGRAAVYLVERYAPGLSALRSAHAVGCRLGVATRDDRVRHLLSALIPGDELCLSLFEAPSEQELGRVLAACGLPFTRIVVALIEAGDLRGTGLTMQEAP